MSLAEDRIFESGSLGDEYVENLVELQNEFRPSRSFGDSFEDFQNFFDVPEEVSEESTLTESIEVIARDFDIETLGQSFKSQEVALNYDDNFLFDDVLSDIHNLSNEELEGYLNLYTEYKNRVTPENQENLKQEIQKFNGVFQKIKNINADYINKWQEEKEDSEAKIRMK